MAALLVVASPFVYMSVKAGEGRHVVAERYNNALVEGDLGSAWGLLCRADRATTDLLAFTRSYTAAVEPLGGRLDDQTGASGRPRWVGPAGSDQRRLDVVDVDGVACVRFGGNPLGEDRT